MKINKSVSRKGFAQVIIIIAVLIIAGVVGYFAFKGNPIPPGQTTQRTSGSLNDKIYKDDRIHVSIPTDWSYTPSTAFERLVSVAKAAESPAGWSSTPATVVASGDATFEFPVGVTLIKDAYILSLITHAGQASGIAGGRLDEIAGISLSLPVGPYTTGCSDFVSRSTKVSDSLERVDLYVDADHATPEMKNACSISGGEGMIWYGSYFTQSCPSGQDCRGADYNGYFLNYFLLTGTKPPFGNYNQGQMAFGLKIKAKSSTDLPNKNDPKLQKMLQEVSKIVASASYVQEEVQKPDIIDAISGTDTWTTTGGNMQWIASCNDTTLDWNKIVAAYQAKMYLNVIEMDLDKYPTTAGDIDTLRDKVATIATDKGWQKCAALNGAQTCSSAAANVGKCTAGESLGGEVIIDVFQKESELMNVKRMYAQNGVNLISVDFDKEGDYVKQVRP